MGQKAPRAGRQMAVHKAADVSADQLHCERLEAHDAVDKVERDRACPDPDEDRGPTPPTPAIDDLMKHAEQQRTQSAAHEHVRGRPDVLDDRELQPPEHPERDRSRRRHRSATRSFGGGAGLAPCRLDLDDKVPHHSTFSENRLNRFRESDILRHIFERVVMAAMAMGLVKGEGFAVDASVMEANASRYHGKAPDELDWTEKQRQKRAVAEYLAALEAEAATEGDAADDAAGGGLESKRPHRYERQPPKVISPSDPQSAWTAKANKRVQFGYGLNYLIDIENAVIVDVEATPARTYDEVAATQTMLDRTEERFDLKPKRLAADTAYGTGKFLGWLVKEKKITPAHPGLGEERSAGRHLLPLGLPLGQEARRRSYLRHG